MAHWKFDECEGTTAHDSSGNANHGTINIGTYGSQTSAGTCTTSGAWANGSSGKLNASLNFDGTDDYVNIPNLPAMTNFSISAWVQPSTTITSEKQIFSAYNDSVGLTVLNQKILYFGGAYFQGTTLLQSGTWYFVTITNNGTTRRIYVNAKEENNAGSPTAISAGAARIGNNTTYSGRNFPGKIDDVRIYNYALTAEQIKTLYNDGAVRFGN